MKRDSLKNHLCGLLSISESTVAEDTYEFLNTEIKRYRKFLKELKLEERDPEGDKIYKNLIDNQITIVNLVAKKRGKENLLREMEEVYTQQKKYYNTKLKEMHEKEAMKNNYRISDVHIEIQEKECKNMICPDIQDYNSQYHWDFFMRSLTEEWNDFIRYIDEVLNLIFSRYYDNQSKPILLLSASKIGEIIEDEKTYYSAVKKNYSLDKKDEKNDNPYKNLYVYYRNSYILDFYSIDFPAIENFLGFKNYVLPFEKNTYSLYDIAEIYKSMMELPVSTDKIYERIKKQFQKLKYMKLFIKNGEYEFIDVSIPLAEYAYYKVKNHNPPQEAWVSANIDPLISDRFAPILNSLLSGDMENVNAYRQLRQFVIKEYYDLFSTLSTSYQNSMKSFLMESSVRIWGRCFGLPFEEVYRDWYDVVAN